jgi:hypothetical protein
MKELFIFGAGASHASCHTPLGKDLVWKYFDDSHGLYRMGDDGKPHPDELEAIEGEFVNLKEFLKSIDEVFPNIKVFDKWQEAINDAKMFVFPFEKQYYIDELMAELLKRGDNKSIKLIQKLTLEHLVKSARGSSNLLYKKFAMNLRSRRTFEEVSIISFNFECLLCTDISDGVYFDYCIDFENIYDELRQYRTVEGGFPLIKLNGSLDWAMNESTNKLSLLFPYVSETTYKDSNSRPYIFLPHQQKLKIMDALWNRAAEEIRSSSKITIIGYSFPAYDKDVIKIFRDNIDLQASIDVVDLEKDFSMKEMTTKRIRSYYNQMFPDVNNLNIYLDGFKGYINGFNV